MAAAAVLLLGVAAPAAGAPPQFLGENPGATKGGCTLCSAFQLSDSGSNPYEAPSDGVLTRVSFYVGPLIEASDYVQARTFRRTGGSSATVISEGVKHQLVGLSEGLHTYFERIPIAAGDVLGGRFETTPTSTGTPHIFETASASDQAVESAFPGPDLGGSFTASPISNRRVNMRATFEPDDDGDGYGDTSQDLCLGSPLGAGPCTGILFGSALQGPYNASGNKCTYACLRVQTVVAGTPTRAPFDGVVVRWRMLAAPVGSYRVRVLGPLAGSTDYSILGSSAAESVPSAPFGAITTYETRVSIPAGGYVALLPPQFTTQPFRTPPLPGSIYTQVNDGPQGSERDVDGTSSGAGEPLYDADIEPDADRDGFGDVSQDACPSDGSAQGACPQPPVPVAPVDDPPERSCGGKRATRVGTAGKDDLRGTKRADVIIGLGGGDTIRALAGNDLVCAGKDRDTVLGGPGRDRLLGEGGVDTLRGGPGKDKLVGGPGKDLQRQ
ncbi:MAG TPA: hypothetical protein VNO20_07970 [Solirubrobacterales bacterium]|nr:hypothetical protein [Solirubrobacterales bacterium]